MQAIRRTNQRKRLVTSLLFLMPLLLVFICFNLIPSLTGIYAAFTKWTLGQKPVWVGLQNLKTCLFDSTSQHYWTLRWGLKNTTLFVLLCVPLRIMVPLLLAFAINTHCRGYKVFQSIYYLPSLMSLAVVMCSWGYMFDTNYGIVNAMLGLGKFSWTNTIPYNWIAIIWISVWWGNGGTMVIYQSALAGIPEEIIESSQIDGANVWQRFIHITIPSIRYPLSYTLATTLIAEFNVWGQPEMFNDGGIIIETVNGFTHKSNLMLMQSIKSLGFDSFGANPGMASAMSLILGIIIVAVSLVQIHLMKENS
ncbi:MAG: sugar ABC transporter permease [Clostridia bacterium]|nr:sugar ABC transporter permease [Clostridia bacterium]